MKQFFDYPFQLLSGCRARFSWQGVHQASARFDEQFDTVIVDFSVLPLFRNLMIVPIGPPEPKGGESVE
jgi:hypothetical protein